jgi:hypothetical protein
MANPRKFHLDISELCVESFETADQAAARGTVRGHEPVDTATGDLRYCACDTFYNTCMGGCAPSQPATCPKPGECQDNETNYQTCFESCGWEGGQAVLRPCWGGN